MPIVDRKLESLLLADGENGCANEDNGSSGEQNNWSAKDDEQSAKNAEYKSPQEHLPYG